MLSTSTFNDTMNADGSVTRVTTVTQANGDSIVQTHTFKAADYLAMQNAVQAQIASLQATADLIAPVVTNVMAVLSAAQAATPADPAQPAPGLGAAASMASSNVTS